jgi:hypothetical protein
MQRACATGLLAAGLLLPFSGCSLMNLDELDARPCQSDADCAQAQQRFGLDATLCGHCVDGLCDFQHRTEACNGDDDDCDGAIDEDVAVTPRHVAGVRAPTGPVAFATATLGPAETYAAIGGSTHEGIVIAPDGSVAAPAELRYASADPNIAPPCKDCWFTDLALAVDAEHLVYVTINTHGCGVGQLWIGLADREDAPFTVKLGTPADAEPGARSNIAVGVDVGNDSCSGASIAKRTASTAAPGARNPAVASIGTTQGAEGALAAWLATSACQDPGCSSPPSVPAPVQALGVYVPAGELSAWLTGTDQGVPQELGQTTSLAPPAIVALDWPPGSANFLVGFASEEQGQRGVSLVRVALRRGRLVHEALAFIRDASAERVTLAVGEVGADGPLVGVAWTTVHGEAPSVDFSTLLPARPELKRAQLTIEAPNLPPGQTPQLLHRSQGFSATPPLGGWFLLWSEQSRPNVGDVKLARLLDAEHEPLDVLTLSTGAIGFPLLVPSGPASVSQVLLRSDEAQGPFESIAAWCGVRG